MILQINGWPGVGKLTVGRIVAKELGGRLLDNHTVYNVAFSLTEFQTPAFYETVRAVRDIAFARIAEIQSDIPVVMTSAYAGSATMEVPQDFLAALRQDPAATAFYKTLKRQGQFAIYYRLHSAKRPETRQKRMAEMLAKLGRGESP